MKKPLYICQERPFWQLETLTGDLISGKFNCEQSPPAWLILGGKVKRPNKILTQMPSPSKGNMRWHTLQPSHQQDGGDHDPGPSFPYNHSCIFVFPIQCHPFIDHLVNLMR